MIIVQIAGRLGRDPESRFTTSGQKVTNLVVATNVRKAGKDETVWWRVVIWGDRFDKMLTYLKKGSAVIAIGEMNKPDIWTDKEGRPQPNLELTADIIRFSPFGNPDAKSESNASSSNLQSHHSSYNSLGNTESKSDGHSSFNQNHHDTSDFGGNMSAYSQSGNTHSNAFGHQTSSQGTTQGRFSQNIPHNEDQIPF